MFRTQLPDFGSSPLVKSCLNVLRQVLPNDLSLQLSIKWYCTRNAPGSHSVGAEEEWSMFSDVLFGTQDRQNFLQVLSCLADLFLLFI